MVSAAYVLGYSAVDDGEIRWGGSTKYSSQWSTAITNWDGLGKVNIAPDNASTYQDLTVKDVSKSNVDWVGLYDYDSIGSDEITFNQYYLDGSGVSDDEKVSAIMHELGHALGLADHIHEGNIMYKYWTDLTAFGEQDMLDYMYLYY